MKMRSLTTWGTACLMTLFLAGTANAELRMEWDFQNGSNASYVVGSINSNVTLFGAATVSTGANTAWASGSDAKIQSGKLNVPDSTGNYLYTAEKHPNVFSNATAGTTAWNPGVGTAVIVWRPFNAASNIREGLFSENNQNEFFSIQLWRNDSEQLHAEFGRSPTNFVSVDSPVITWKTNSFYLIAVTWDSHATGADTTQTGDIALHVQRLDDGLLSSVTASGNLVWTGLHFGYVGYMNLGRRHNVSGEYAEGEYALVRLYDEYFDQSRFQAEHAALVSYTPPTDLVAEWDFRDANGMDPEDLSYSIASKEGVLNTAPTINTGANTGLPPSTVAAPSAKLTDGRLIIPAVAGITNELHSSDYTSDFISSMRATTFGGPGTGTFMVVYSPLNAPSGREFLLSHSFPGDRAAIHLYRDSGAAYLTLGRNGPENYVAATTSVLTWDTDSYYMIVGTWDEGSGDAAVYVRELVYGSSTTAATGNGTMTGGATACLPYRLYVGNRYLNWNEYAEGDYSLVRVYDSFFTEDRFNSEFDDLMGIFVGTTIIFR